MSQLERLKKDVKELDHYIYKLAKKNKPELAQKMMKKRDFLQQHITEAVASYRGV
jgi:hypothetical protein